MSPHATNENEPEDPVALFPEPPREHIINTAVKFLQNPRVRPTSLSHKQKFLKQKGLTDEEVELACQKAGAYSMENSQSGPVVVARPYYEKPSIWIKAKDVANLVALFSIGSYSLYSLWKRYIAPRLFGTRSRNEQNYQSLLAAIAELNRNVMDLKDLIRDLQGPATNPHHKARQQYELQEIKSELSSIKSLLLSRSQFPTTPSGIPAWQMLAEPSNPSEEGRGTGGGDDNDQDLDTSAGGGSVGGRQQRRKSKSQKPGRKEVTTTTATQAPVSSSTAAASPIMEGNPSEILSLSEAGSSNSGPGRKHSSVDSNNGFHSGSSCEVVFVGGKNDSEPDHSDD